MKTRIIAAAVLLPVLALIVLVAPPIVAAIVLGLLMMVGEYELLFTTGLVRHVRMVLYSAMMAFGLSIWSYYDAIPAVGILAVLAFWLLLFIELMADHVKVSVEMVASCFFAGAVVPYLLTSLIRILTLSTGRYLIPIPFIVAFSSDAGAYFVGMRFGRHKLAPVVSPNKTIEGLGGGLASSVVFMLIYALILRFALKFQVNFAYALLYGLFGGGIDVFGDLSFSIIKRQSGIKDYGMLIPGHGGFFDRFDSMVLVAPLMEALILLIPLAV